MIFFYIGNVFKPEELNGVTSQILNGDCVDGKITAGVGASVKDNLQLKADSPLANELNKIVIQALWSAQPFQSDNSEIVNSN